MPLLNNQTLAAALRAGFMHEYAAFTAPAYKNATDAIVAALSPNIPDMHVTNRRLHAALRNKRWPACVLTAAVL